MDRVRFMPLGAGDVVAVVAVVGVVLGEAVAVGDCVAMGVFCEEGEELPSSC